MILVYVTKKILMWQAEHIKNTMQTTSRLYHTKNRVVMCAIKNILVMHIKTSLQALTV